MCGFLLGGGGDDDKDIKFDKSCSKFPVIANPKSVYLPQLTPFPTMPNQLTALQTQHYLIWMLLLFVGTTLTHFVHWIVYLDTWSESKGDVIVFVCGWQLVANGLSQI